MVGNGSGVIVVSKIPVFVKAWAEAARTATLTRRDLTDNILNMMYSNLEEQMGVRFDTKPGVGETSQQKIRRKEIAVLSSIHGSGQHSHETAEWIVGVDTAQPQVGSANHIRGGGGSFPPRPPPISALRSLSAEVELSTGQSRHLRLRGYQGCHKRKRLICRILPSIRATVGDARLEPEHSELPRNPPDFF